MPGGGRAAGVLVLRGEPRGSSSVAIRGEVVVGRSSECELAVEDPAVSRRHLRLEEADGSIVVEDLGSRAGTWVDGRRVERATLRSGDRITLGSTELLVLGAGRMAPMPDRVGRRRPRALAAAAAVLLALAAVAGAREASAWRRAEASHAAFARAVELARAGAYADARRVLAAALRSDPGRAEAERLDARLAREEEAGRAVDEVERLLRAGERGAAAAVAARVWPGARAQARLRALDPSDGGAGGPGGGPMEGDDAAAAAAETEGAAAGPHGAAPELRTEREATVERGGEPGGARPRGAAWARGAEGAAARPHRAAAGRRTEREAKVGGAERAGARPRGAAPAREAEGRDRGAVRAGDGERELARRGDGAGAGAAAKGRAVTGGAEPPTPDPAARKRAALERLAARAEGASGPLATALLEEALRLDRELGGTGRAAELERRLVSIRLEAARKARARGDPEAARAELGHVLERGRREEGVAPLLSWLREEARSRYVRGYAARERDPAAAIGWFASARRLAWPGDELHERAGEWIRRIRRGKGLPPESGGAEAL